MAFCTTTPEGSWPSFQRRSEVSAAHQKPQRRFQLSRSPRQANSNQDLCEPKWPDQLPCAQVTHRNSAAVGRTKISFRDTIMPWKQNDRLWHLIGYDDPVDAFGAQQGDIDLR